MVTNWVEDPDLAVDAPSSKVVAIVKPRIELVPGLGKRVFVDPQEDAHEGENANAVV